MNKTSKDILMEVLLLAMQVGIPAVMDLIKTWDKDDITIEDFEELRLQIKQPADYL